MAMIASRGLQLAARRAGTPAFFSKFVPAGSVMQTRLAVTQQRISSDHSEDLLVKQRLNRPVSPHLTIYQPQITWYGSSLHRITGAMLSGTIYVYGMAYLAAPYVGYHIGSASLAAAVGALPWVMKAGIKYTIAWPFMYHAMNGIRHLAWDLGFWFTNKQVQVTGWGAIILSTLSAVYLAVM